MKDNLSASHYLCRTCAIWVGEAGGMLLFIYIIPGLSVDSFEAAVLFVGTLALINAVLWPLLSRLLLPFLMFTFGVGTLLLNAFGSGLQACSKPVWPWMGGVRSSSPRSA